MAALNGCDIFKILCDPAEALAAGCLCERGVEAGGLIVLVAGGAGKQIGRGAGRGCREGSLTDLDLFFNALFEMPGKDLGVDGLLS